MIDPVVAYRAMREQVGAAWLAREVIRATGPDVVGFLQGQLSQDVTRIDVGGSAWSWVLQPHGKVDALLRLTRTSDEVFLIDVDRRFGAPVVERLERFKMRTRVDFEILDWKTLALRGPRSAEIALDRVQNDVVVTSADWPGLPGVDLLGPALSVPDGVPLGDANVLDALRIESGFPEMGSELDERTIPAEAGLVDRTISFTKGCYTGQELIARIDARGGNVPRHLRGLVVDMGSEGNADNVDLIGARVFALGRVASTTKPLGVITSAARSPHFDTLVALAFIRREMVVPGPVQVVSDDGTFEARVETLPLVGP